MSAKHYPNTVTVKKNLRVFTVVVVIGIVGLIGYEMLHFGSVATSSTTRDDPVFRVANIQDTDWADAETVPTANTPSVSNNVHSSTITTQPVTPANPTLPPNYENQEAAQALQKAMSAPITSNQLTAPITTNTGTLGAALSTANSSHEDDVNLQREKQAFLSQAQAASDPDVLTATVKNPLSPYEVQAGTIIPGILITGVNSDLPGQLTGQVRTNVYDSISGRYVLVPQGARLTGVYDSRIVYGQQRVLIVWRRIIFPNGQSINLQGMPGVDLSGYAGFHDQVNNHYSTIFGSVLLMSILSAGAQLSQPQNSNTPYAAPTVGQMLAQSLGTNISDVGTALTQKNLNVQPTLDIRPGYLFNISVTKDIVFDGAYHE